MSLRIALIVPGMTRNRLRRSFTSPQPYRQAQSIADGRAGGVSDRPSVPALAEMNHHASESPAEKGDGNGDKGEVIPDGGGINAGEPDFEHQPGECCQEDACAYEL